MKKVLIMLACAASLAACSSEESTEEQATPTEETISEEDKSELKEAQDANVELEKLDGEVDSLLNTL